MKIQIVYGEWCIKFLRNINRDKKKEKKNSQKFDPYLM